jgi:hypothetical protein
MRHFLTAVLLVAVPVAGVVVLAFVTAGRSVPTPTAPAVTPAADLRPEVARLRAELETERRWSHMLMARVLTRAQIRGLVEVAVSDPDLVPPEILARELADDPEWGPVLREFRPTAGAGR